ncbi:hypothetical protein QA601_06320 [Chitinispirillales bacterium ANBcel5]|uniref:hypothetical protein n=1 Tax=Cellulosispirillum alkaliphilum TaxID=3039283 RepID=UPI002A4FAA42|nr:hypothetical protein [Chitinispirillales bacterium ANBcel5]
MVRYREKKPAPCPRITVPDVAQKANDIVVACTRDREDLEKAHFQWEKVQKLNDLGWECMDAQAEWIFCKERSRKETKALERYVKECQSLRREITDGMRAANTFNQFLIVIPSYRNSKSRAELVQDLHDLFILCEHYEEDLRKGGFNTALIRKAFDESWNLSNQIADTVLERERLLKQVRHRNEVCKATVDLIRDIGGFARTVFANDPRKSDYRTSRRHF